MSFTQLLYREFRRLSMSERRVYWEAVSSESPEVSTLPLLKEVGEYRSRSQAVRANMAAMARILLIFFILLPV